AVLGEKGVDKLALGGGTVNIGIVPDTVVPSMADVAPCPGAGGGSSTSSVVWQLSTGVIDGVKPRYRDVSPVGDTTAGLTRPGVVRFDLPTDVTAFGVFTPADPDAAGTGDFPPEIDAALDVKLLFWLRAFRADGEQLGSLLWVDANAASIEQVQDASAEYLGTGTGDAGQTATLAAKPVLPT